MPLETIELAKGTKSGQWWPSDAPDRRRSAMLRCPQCGLPAFLYGYDIADDGVVQPPFACEGVECEFEGTLSLTGWVPRSPR